MRCVETDSEKKKKRTSERKRERERGMLSRLLKAR